MKKQGFLLIWSIILIAMVAISMSVSINSRDGSVIVYDKVKKYEMAYHHVITIEDWAKTYLKKYESYMRAWMNNSHNLESKLVTDKTFKIIGDVGDEDGKINLYGLMVDEEPIRAVYEEMMEKVFGQEYRTIIEKIKPLLMSGRRVIGSGILGTHEAMFSDRIRSEDLKTTGIHKFPKKNKININTLHVGVAKIIFDIDVDELESFKDDGPYERISEVLHRISIKPKYRNIIKFDSLFYYVDGSIIQGKSIIKFRINLTNNNGNIETTYRNIR